MNEKCDKFGNILENNLSKSQLRDMKNLKSRIKNEHLVCGETDKTGRLTLDTLENVKNKMKKHIENDKVMNEKKVKTLENKLNSHMQSWFNMLNPE